jgi:hypothetical protein
VFPALTVAAGAAAALAFALSAVIEQRCVHTVPQRGALDPRLLLDLARERLWLAAIGLSLAGLALQITALHFGPLTLVQSVLVCDVLFAVLIRALLAGRRWPDRVVLAGVLCCAGGLAAFLAIARPHGDRFALTPLSVVPLAAVLAGVLAACLAAARFGPAQARPVALGLACGVIYGVTAFLLKEISHSIGQGGSPLAQLWPLYAVVVLGPLAFLLNQSAFQAGVLIAPALSVITVTDPLVSIAVAVLWLGEHLAATPADIAAEVAALAVMAIGIIVLARRAPQVAGRVPVPASAAG